MAVTLLRHTRPATHKGLCYGRTDLPLADSFAEDARSALRDLNRPTAIVSSPLRRCKLLADQAAALFDLPVTVSDAWIEMDFGQWEGRAWSDIPRADLDCWAAEFMTYCGHGGESVHALQTRVSQGLAAMPDDALVVTHAGCIKAALAVTGQGEGWQAQPAFGSALRVQN